MKRVNYHLTEKQIKELRRYAKRSGLFVAEIIRRAIDQYIESERQDEKGEGIKRSWL